MGKATHGSRGFTLIASLLLLVLLSAIAVGLMYTVTGAGHVGGNDLESNIAFYGAESGMEKLTSDVLSLYQQKLSPVQADLTSLAQTSPPSSAQIPGMTYLESATWTNVDSKGNPITTTNVVSQGAYSGLTAEIIPMTLQVSAMRPSGAAVNITRSVEIAMIPVFQFGVFSDSDLSYFPGPPFGFLGRVHTNGNLYLNANSGPLVIGDKVTVAGQILRDRLADNYTAGGSGYFGDVYLATATGGCDTFAAAVQTNGSATPPKTGCVNWGKDSDNSTDDSSWSGGIPLSASPGASNKSWASISSGTFNSFAETGVPVLQMPFVQGAQLGQANTADQQIEIIRKPQTSAESPSSPIGASREFNKANVRILLGDNEAELHPGSPGTTDPQDIQLDSAALAASGVAIKSPAGTAFFAVADKTGTGEPNFIVPRCKPGTTATAPYPIVPESSCTAWTPAAPWPLVRGWLRVEYLDKASGSWLGVTTEWLKYGFARDVTSPTKPVTVGGAGTNDVHPDAILIFQQLADRNGSGSVTNGQVQVGTDSKGKAINATESTAATGSNNNFYPINFFDPREGFPRDGPALGGTQCYVNGIMNAVELDAGNLAQWLAGNGAYAGGSGKSVNSGPQNGYLVYFSDRRGQMPNPNSTPTPNTTNGESGLEDVINSSDLTNGLPDGSKEPITAGYNDNNGYSPEDVDENGLLDNWGAANIGDGFGINTSLPAGKPNPYAAVDCMNGGRQNWVSGARHVLRLVDGALGYLPMPGFTVASENPVYVKGDYNSNSTDTIWKTPAVDTTLNAAAAVIADAVTLLSNDWTDLNDMKNPSNLNGREPANDTSFRVAIASGKNMNFPNITGAADFGTDGGVHNFLRYIENLGNITVNYRGSLISMYYSEYATGTFKCCSFVYGPPTRNYSFDKDFLTPTNLPPGTPMLQDIDTLSYWQNFTPCTTQTNGACTN
jgi:Tfp pilus assembly protein PilX